MKNEFEEKILNYMRETVHRPMPAEELAAGMDFSGAELDMFWEALAVLENVPL